MPATQLPAIGPFPLGVDNRRPDHDLTQTVGNGAVDLLRAAVNVDVGDTGKLRRREGYQLLHAGRAHSAWGNGREGFYADAGTLYHLRQDAGGTLQRAEVRGDLHPARPLAYCEAGGAIYYTNGEVLGMVRGGARLDFTPAPLLAPQVSAAGGGPGGRAGCCHVCITHEGPAGESGATFPTAVLVPEGGQVALTGVQAPPAGCTVSVYATAPDGEVFMCVQSGWSGGALQFAPPAAGAPCQTLLLQAMPPGSAVQFSNARLVVASGSTLVYSEPFLPGLYDPSKNFVQFPEPITLLAACGSGLFVSAGRTYWLEGEITQASLREVLPYAALPRSLGHDPSRADACFWASERGLVFGAADGSVKNVQEDRLALAGGTSAATVLRERQGQQHVLSSIHNPGKTRAAFGGSFGAEIIRARNP